MILRSPISTLFPYTTLFRSIEATKSLGLDFAGVDLLFGKNSERIICEVNSNAHIRNLLNCTGIDRKSTRLNSSHVAISYAVFCLKKKIIYNIIVMLQ